MTAEFDDERAILLNFEESVSHDADDSIVCKREEIQPLGFHSEPYSADGVTGSGLSRPPYTQFDQILAIFVVAFDTKAGNIIEWCLPEGIDLEGVEFKAMTSGSHTLLQDFVYFRKKNYFGLACFENMKVESHLERGARMKSVGILASSYTLLYRHMQFLMTQVRHQLQTPGRYQQLEAFYEDKKGMLKASNSMHNLGIPSPVVTSTNHIIPEIKISHPSGCFSSFLHFFGAHVMVLWKFALLKKRILFFSPPPIGDVCYRVYCLCCAANRSITHTSTDFEVKPHFYVNVADIDMLESEITYIACTTEKIFESKPHLYDVYVNEQCVTEPSGCLKDVLKLSPADRDKFNRINTLRSAQDFALDEMDAALEEEDVFTMFFLEENNRIFQTLHEVSNSPERQLTAEHMASMGLDVEGDRAFLMELVEIYGIDVMLMVDNPCCPK